MNVIILLIDYNLGDVFVFVLESERLAAEAVNRETGKRGRGRGRGRGTNPPANAIANINPNRTRGAATAATRSVGQ